MKKTILFVLLVVLPAVLAVAEPTINLVEPMGGDLCLGRQCLIQWTVSDYSGKIRIVLLKSGSTVGVIATDLDATPSTFDWTVGNYQGGAVTEWGTNYKIRIRSVGEGPSDQSNKLTLNKCIDPGIFKHLRDIRRVLIKWPPLPDPCLCPEFEVIKIRDLLGNPTDIYKIQLLKNGSLLQELATFGRGKALPDKLRAKLGAEDFALMREGRAEFTLALIGENGKIVNEFDLEGGQEQLLR